MLITKVSWQNQSPLIPQIKPKKRTRFQVPLKCLNQIGQLQSKTQKIAWQKIIFWVSLYKMNLITMIRNRSKGKIVSNWKTHIHLHWLMMIWWVQQLKLLILYQKYLQPNSNSTLKTRISSFTSNSWKQISCFRWGDLRRLFPLSKCLSTKKTFPLSTILVMFSTHQSNAVIVTNFLQRLVQANSNSAATRNLLI